MLVLHTILCFLVHSQAVFSASKHVTRENDCDVLDWIDPLIGSKSGGNVFAGATLPYGMAKGLQLPTRDLTVQH